jgi:peroxiredoxin
MGQSQLSAFGVPKHGKNCEKGQTMTAEIGEVAPDFALPTANNETISLAQFRGQKHVILSFHVFNFTSG